MTDEELIRQVAEKVIGWDIYDQYEPPIYVDRHCDAAAMTIAEWNPLTNLNHTFMVVEMMREFGFDIHIDNYSDDDEGYRVQFPKPDELSAQINRAMDYLNKADKKGEKLEKGKLNRLLSNVMPPVIINKSIGHAVCEAALMAMRHG